MGFGQSSGMGLPDFGNIQRIVEEDRLKKEEKKRLKTEEDLKAKLHADDIAGQESDIAKKKRLREQGGGRESNIATSRSSRLFDGNRQSDRGSVSRRTLLGF